MIVKKITEEHFNTVKESPFIRQYMGWSASKMIDGRKEPLTLAPAFLLNLFSIVAEFILVVPDVYFEDTIAHLKNKRYAYKVAKHAIGNIIAVQYNKL
jgi:hypothetical protein